MRIIERYILRRMTSIFLAAMLSTLAIAWTTQVLQRLNLVTDTGQSAAAFLKLATLLLPTVIPEVVPFAVAIAVSQTLMTMNSDSELAVINASGAPRATVARPVIILGFAAALISFFTNNLIEPAARQEARNLIAAARAELISSFIQEGSFRKVENGLFMQVGERLPDGRLGSVFVADSRQKDIDLVYFAKTAALGKVNGSDVLVMQDGQIQRRKPGEPVSIIRFRSYSFELADFSAADTKEVLLYPKDRETGYLLNPDPNDRFLKTQPLLITSELHKRLSTWLLPIAFAMIALSVAGDARSHREARINPIAATISIAFLVRWLSYFAYGKAAKIAGFGYVLYLIPIVAAILAFRAYLAGQRIGLPAAWEEKIQDGFDKARDRFEQWRIRMASFRPWRAAK